MINRWSVGGSLIGGVKECQECIDFCHAHKIYPDCETITASKIDWAWDQLLGAEGNPDGIRYVIDIKKSLTDDSFLPAKEWKETQFISQIYLARMLWYVLIDVRYDIFNHTDFYLKI